MDYPIKKGWYSHKDTKKQIEVVDIEGNLVQCKQDGRVFVVLDEIFVKKFEWLGNNKI